MTATLLDRARAAIKALGYAQREDLGCTTRQFRDLARTLRDAGEARTEEVLLAPTQRPAYTVNQLRVLHAWRDSRAIPLALIVARSGLSEPTARATIKSLTCIVRIRLAQGGVRYRLSMVTFPVIPLASFAAAPRFSIKVSDAERDRIEALHPGTRIQCQTYADHRVMGQLERDGITTHQLTANGKVFWYRSGS